MVLKVVHKLARERTDHTGIQMFRYLFVAGAAFAVDFGVLFALTQFAHVYYLLSATISFSLGLVVNYLLSTHWVFNSRTLQDRRVEFMAFGVIGVLGLLLMLLLMWLLTSGLGVHYLLSKIAATAVVFFWNFLARKYLLFNNRQQ